jgi:hypothetical protein
MLYIIGCSTTPEREKVLSERTVIWMGIDYSLAKFSDIEESPESVFEKLPAINNVVVNEAAKYNVKKYFRKSEVTYDLTIVNSNNSKIDAAKLVTAGIYTITPDDVKKLINSYNIKDKTGMGLVFVAENMNKSKKPEVIMSAFLILLLRILLILKEFREKQAVLVSEISGQDLFWK